MQIEVPNYIIFFYFIIRYKLLRMKRESKAIVSYKGDVVRRLATTSGCKYVKQRALIN